MNTNEACIWIDLNEKCVERNSWVTDR